SVELISGSNLSGSTPTSSMRLSERYESSTWSAGDFPAKWRSTRWQKGGRHDLLPARSGRVLSRSLRRLSFRTCVGGACFMDSAHPPDGSLGLHAAACRSFARNGIGKDAGPGSNRAASSQSSPCRQRHACLPV